MVCTAYDQRNVSGRALLRHVINEFLDEQEALYNNIDYIEDFILEMKDDHVVLTFDNKSQFKKIVKTFVKRGIDCNQIDVLFSKNF